MRTVYKSIDLIKFIMALFVVTIHCNIINSIDNEFFNRICTSIIYSAVPFFYVTSAYLLFRHINLKRDFKNKFKKYYIHIAKMYIFWFVLYNLNKVNHILTNENITETLTNVVNNFFFLGNGHLWYLWGLLLILPLIYKLFLSINSSIIVIIGFGLTCMFRLYSHYGSVEYPVWWQEPLVYMWQGHFFNVFGVCYAFAYIAIGLFMATTKKWKNLSTNNLLIILAIGFTYCCIDTDAVSIGYQPVAFAIVALCLKWQIASKSLYFDYCRNISTYIYI